MAAWHRRDLHFHHNWATWLKACLKAMKRLSQSVQYNQRITANKVAPLIQQQTHLIFHNFFTIKPPIIKSFKSSYYEAAWQEMLCFHQQYLNMTPETAESEHNETVKQTSEGTKRTRESKEIQWDAAKDGELNTQTFKNVFLSGFLHRHELSIDLQHAQMKGRRCLLGVGCSRESSLQPAWRWGRRDLALLRSSQTGDGKANRCSFVLKKKKRRHKLLLSYLGIKWSLTITTATTSEDSPPQKKQWWKPKTKNFAQSIGIFTLTTQQLWQNTFKFVSNFYRDSLSSRNILHLLGKTSCYPVRIQTTESKAWLDMNGFFDKQHYMFLFWKQWCLPY